MTPMKDILVFIDPENLPATKSCLDQIARDLDGFPVKLGLFGTIRSDAMEKAIKFATGLSFDAEFTWNPGQLNAILSSRLSHYFMLDKSSKLIYLIRTGLFVDKMVVLVSKGVVHEFVCHNPKCNSLLIFMDTGELENGN